METAQREHLTRLHFLVRATQAIAEAGLDERALSAVLVREVTAAIGDMAVLRLLTDDGAAFAPAMASYHPDPAANEILRHASDRPEAVEVGLAGRIVRSGRPVRIDQITSDQMKAGLRNDAWPAVERLGIGSYLGVPVRARGAILGVLTLARAGPGRPYTDEDELLVEDLAARTGLAIEQARLYRVEQRMREHESVLAAASRRLAESLDPAATLAAVADLVVPALADWCIVDLLAEDGTVERAAVVHADPARAELAAGLRRYPPDLGQPHGGADAMRTGRSELNSAVTDETLVRFARDEGHLALLRAMGPVSHMRVPLLARGRVLGSLLLVMAESGRRYDADDQALAEGLAGRCALALDNARLHAAEEDARWRAAALAEASAVLAADLDYEARLTALSRLVVPSLADWCVVDLLGDDGLLHRLAAVHADPALQPAADELLRRYPTLAPDADHTITRVLATGTAWLDPAVSEEHFVAEARDPDHLALIRRLGFASEMVVPLVARGRPLGTVSLAFGTSGRRHTPEDLAMAQDLAGRAALALDAARLYTAERAARARYRGLFEGSADALFVSDAAGRLREVNEAAVALTGYGRDELHTMTASELLADPTRVDAELARLASERSWRGEVELRRKDGSAVPIEAQATAVDLPDGTIYVWSARDIAERRGLERLQQEFLALVSHDLKNPLAGIRGHAQLLQRRKAYAERSVGAIVSETGRLERLIDDLLDVTRAQTGQLTLARDWADFLAPVRAAVEAAREVSAAHVIELAAPEWPLIAFFDRDRVEQVVQNLLLNAIKYSPAGGAVRVQVEERGDEIWVTVADEGIGIAPEAQPHLFERFYRTAEARELKLPGLGLGLYVTRSLVEAHGGRIWAESEGSGRGSRFTAVLPRHPDRRAMPSPAAPPAGVKPASV